MKAGLKSIPLVLLVLCILLMIGLGPRLYQQHQLAAAMEKAQDTPLEVQFERPTQVKDPGLTLPASLEPLEDTHILSRTAGYVRRRLVDIGDHVRRGQLLAEVESPEVDAQLTQAEAQSLQSVATVHQSQADAERLRANILQAVATRNGGEAGVRHAEAAALSNRAAVVAARRTLDSRHSDVDNDRAQTVFAEREWKRYQVLGQQGFVTSEQVDTRQAAYKSAVGVLHSAQGAEETARANVDVAIKTLEASEADVRSAEDTLKADDESIKATVAALRSGEETITANVASARASSANQRHFQTLTGFERVVAPFDGVITTRSIDRGFLVDPTSSTYEAKGLFEEARTDQLLLNVQVPQAYFAVMRTGLSGDVLVRELPGQTFTGKVFKVSGALDATTRTVQTQIVVSNEHGTLLPGMYVEAHFAPLSMKPVLHVVSTSLVIDKDGTRVAEINDQDQIHYIPVKLGRDFGAETEIIFGLKGSERVVVNPSEDLIEGLKVTPQEQTPPSPAAKK